MNEPAASFDYLKVTVEEGLLSRYIEGYGKFGWSVDENVPAKKSRGKATIHMKRGRHITNKAELARLQQHYEACMEEIRTLEASKSSVPAMASLIGVLSGCGAVTGSVLAAAAAPPVVWLTVLLSISGLILWAAACLCYKPVKRHRIQKVLPLIETKYEEAYEVCEKASRLLHV